ncbi:hypothetical protein MMC22_008912 [Lobaria immixta]|nr:hypothetical protein [Lobaria immixta]
MLVFDVIVLAFLFVSACSAAPTAAPTDSSEGNTLNRSEPACVGLGACPGILPPSPTPATSSVRPPPPPSITPAPARPASSTKAPVVLQSSINPYLYACSNEQGAAIKEAWAEAGTLADAHAEWRPPARRYEGKWQAAQALYLGDDSKNDDPWLGVGPLKRSSGFSPPALIKKMSNGKSRKYQSAASHPSPRSKRTIVAPELQIVIDPWQDTRAHDVFHETYHWYRTVSRPPCDREPEIYTPREVVFLARTENTKGAMRNAESFAFAALAMYVQQTFKLPSPSVPRQAASVPLPTDPRVTDTETHAGDYKDVYLHEMPDWFAPPVAQGAPFFKPDLSGVVQLSSVPSSVVLVQPNSTS